MGDSVLCAIIFFTQKRLLCYIQKSHSLLFRFSSLPVLPLAPLYCAKCDIYENIREIKFEAFDAIYFFNAFYENIVQSAPIDNSVELDKMLYVAYSWYMRKQLDAMPVGTRLATYFSYLDEVPDSYEIQCVDFDNKLKMWVKTT
jgi:hypothetical protein